MKTKTSITTDGSRGENKKRSAKGKVGQILSGSQKINEIEHAEHTLVAEERGGGGMEARKHRARGRASGMKDCSAQKARKQRLAYALIFAHKLLAPFTPVHSKCPPASAVLLPFRLPPDQTRVISVALFH